MTSPEARASSAPSGWVRVGRWISSGPASTTYLLLMWAVAGGTGSLLTGPPAGLASSTLFEGRASLAHPFSLALSAVWGPGLGSYLMATAVLLVLGVAVERHLGSTRFAAIALAAHALATLTLAVTTWALSFTSTAWVDSFFAVRFGGPFVGVLGAAMASTTTMSTLWRRRIRVAVLSLLGTTVLFHGGGVSVLLLVGSVAGLLLGRVGRSTSRPRSAVGSVHEMRMLAAVVVAGTAVGPLLAALSSNPTGPFAILGFLVAPVRGPRPEVVAQLCAEAPTSVACTLARLHQDPSLATTFMACLPALLLLVAAEGLRRGRRSAWLAAIFLEGLLAVVAIVDYVLTLTDRATVPATVSLSDEQPVSLLTQLVLPSVVPVTVIVIVLLLGRGLFRLRGPRGDGLRMARRVVIAAAGCTLVYVATGLLFPLQWAPTATVLSLLADLPLRLAPLELTLGFITEHRPIGPMAHLAYDWTGPTFWVVTCVLVLRSYRAEPHSSSAGRSQAQVVLSASGGGSIAWMGMWQGNSYWFTPTGRSYVPYRVVRGVALTTGDPIGPTTERGSTSVLFADFCERRGWVPCFYSAGAALAEELTAAGWSALQIAEDTIVDLTTLSFTGRRFQDVRTALNAAKREGMRVRWVTYASAPLSVSTQIRSISEEWVSQRDLPEMGFTLGGLEQLRDPEVRCSVVEDSAGEVHAVASWLPIHAEGGHVSGWTLDFMRRRERGFRSAIELLIAQSALDLQAEGFQTLSLSGSPLAKVRQDKAAAPSVSADSSAAQGSQVGRNDALERVLDVVGTTLEPVYGFRSLQRFKAKFQPAYQPLFLLYADGAALPAIGRSVGLAYVPEASVRTLVSMVGVLRRSSDIPRTRTSPSWRRSRSRKNSDVTAVDGANGAPGA